jgi:hypothetical protein
MYTLWIGWDSAGNLAEVVAMLVKCGAVRMTGKSGDPIVGDGNGGGPFTGAAAGSHNSPLASDISITLDLYFYMIPDM